MSETRRRWHLTASDKAAPLELAEAVAALARLAHGGHDLIAIGEAWDALERIASGHEVDVNVGLDVGFRRGDAEFQKGLFVCFRVNDEEIVLDELTTTYSSDIGSDHITRGYAVLSPRGRFDEIAVAEWMAKLHEVSTFDDAALTADRAHV